MQFPSSMNLSSGSSKATLHDAYIRLHRAFTKSDRDGYTRAHMQIGSAESSIETGAKLGSRLFKFAPEKKDEMDPYLAPDNFKRVDLPASFCANEENMNAIGPVYECISAQNGCAQFVLRNGKKESDGCALFGKMLYDFVGPEYQKGPTAMEFVLPFQPQIQPQKVAPVFMKEYVFENTRIEESSVYIDERKIEFTFGNARLPETDSPKFVKFEKFDWCNDVESLVNLTSVPLGQVDFAVQRSALLMKEIAINKQLERLDGGLKRCYGENSAKYKRFVNTYNAEINAAKRRCIKLYLIQRDFLQSDESIKKMNAQATFIWQRAFANIHKEFDLQGILKKMGAKVEQQFESSREEGPTFDIISRLTVILAANQMKAPYLALLRSILDKINKKTMGRPENRELAYKKIRAKLEAVIPKIIQDKKNELIKLNKFEQVPEKDTQYDLALGAHFEENSQAYVQLFMSMIPELLEALRIGYGENESLMSDIKEALRDLSDPREFSLKNIGAEFGADDVLSSIIRYIVISITALFLMVNILGGIWAPSSTNLSSILSNSKIPASNRVFVDTYDKIKEKGKELPQKLDEAKLGLLSLYGNAIQKSVQPTFSSSLKEQTAIVIKPESNLLEVFNQLTSIIMEFRLIKGGVKQDFITTDEARDWRERFEKAAYRDVFGSKQIGHEEPGIISYLIPEAFVTNEDFAKFCYDLVENATEEAMLQVREGPYQPKTLLDMNRVTTYDMTPHIENVKLPAKYDRKENTVDALKRTAEVVMNPKTSKQTNVAKMVNWGWTNIITTPARYFNAGVSGFKDLWNEDNKDDTIDDNVILLGAAHTIEIVPEAPDARTPSYWTGSSIRRFANLFARFKSALTDDPYANAAASAIPQALNAFTGSVQPWIDSGKQGMLEEFVKRALGDQYEQISKMAEKVFGFKEEAGDILGAVAIIAVLAPAFQALYYPGIFSLFNVGMTGVMLQHDLWLAFLTFLGFLTEEEDISGIVYKLDPSLPFYMKLIDYTKKFVHDSVANVRPLIPSRIKKPLRIVVDILRRYDIYYTTFWMPLTLSYSQMVTFGAYSISKILLRKTTTSVFSLLNPLNWELSGFGSRFLSWFASENQLNTIVGGIATTATGSTLYLQRERLANGIIAFGHFMRKLVSLDQPISGTIVEYPSMPQWLPDPLKRAFSSMEKEQKRWYEIAGNLLYRYANPFVIYGDFLEYSNQPSLLRNYRLSIPSIWTVETIFALAGKRDWKEILPWARPLPKFQDYFEYGRMTPAGESTLKGLMATQIFGRLLYYSYYGLAVSNAVGLTLMSPLMTDTQAQVLAQHYADISGGQIVLPEDHPFFPVAVWISSMKPKYTGFLGRFRG